MVAMLTEKVSLLLNHRRIRGGPWNLPTDDANARLTAWESHLGDVKDRFVETHLNRLDEEKNLDLSIVARTGIRHKVNLTFLDILNGKAAKLRMRYGDCVPTYDCFL